MTPRSPFLRAPGTRVHRPQAQHGLEAVASEFALLAQRRARMLRQIELLDRQRHAADAAFQRLDTRMSILGRRLARLDAGITQPAAPPAAPPSPPPAPPPPAPVSRAARFAHPPAARAPGRRFPAPPRHDARILRTLR